MARPPLVLAAAPLVGALVACTPGESPDGPTPLWTDDPADFWDAPWPSDLRRDDDGTIRMSDFPNPRGVPVIDQYVARGDQLDGFGTSSPMYLPVDGWFDAGDLPSPAETAQEGSPLQLVDIDPNSPRWGTRIPVLAEQLTGVSEYYREQTLAVIPVPGFPLRPATRYALLLTTDVASPNAAFVETLEPGHPHFDADLHQALWFLGLEADDLAIAATFTTYDPLEEMARIADFLQHQVVPPDLSRHPLVLTDSFPSYVVYETHYPSPIFTFGTRPFNTEGGEFRFDDAGRPLIAGWDDMRLSVCAPHDLHRPPPGGWPVVIVQHGTGGDYRSDCRSSSVFEPSGRFAREGGIALGIDQPLHGTRSGGAAASDLAHFNFVNPDSGLTNFRQGAADAIYLARALASRQWELPIDGGGSVRLDPERISFFGHSQGGLTGGIAAPFLGADVEQVVLSGAGGVLAITLVERKDILDFAALIEALLQFEPDEALTIAHPASALIQTLSEVTDTVNYAPYWFAERGDWRGHTPVDVLLTNGTLDANTPYQTAIALAAAGRLPILEGPVTAVEALSLRGARRWWR